MLVGKNEFRDVLNKFKTPGFYAIDCETTGLTPYLGDELFSIILADEHQGYYFNFNTLFPDEPSLLPKSFLTAFQEIFDVEGSVYAGHNFKFDMHFLAKEGLTFKGKVHCTMATQRVLNNRQLRYGLDACVKPLGFEKSDAVEEYIKKHGLWEWYSVPGKKKREKRPFYAKVPTDIMVEYGLRDAVITRALAVWQQAELVRKKLYLHGKRKETLRIDPLSDVLHNEHRLTKTCFEMERYGILVDTVYCEKAVAYEERRLEEAKSLFTEISGLDYADSRITLREAFEKAGEEIFFTEGSRDKEKKNASFDDDVLSTYSSPLAGAVKVIRDASKRANTYYRNYIDLADDDNIIHYDLKQAGTDTGRFSCANPNLQNVPKEDSSEYPVRKAFIPPDDYCLVRIDYDQVEYRLMLNYAQEMGVIKKIKEGLDVHQATADLVGIPRQNAKTLNFLLLYGGGIAKLASALDITIAEAAELRQIYFANLPAVSKWTQGVKNLSARYLFIVNWMGRVCEFLDASEAYKAPNHLIQGGVADIIKVAMNNTHERLAGMRSRQVLQVHDELVFYIHKAELDIVPDLVRIMESVYTKGALPLTAGVSHSWHNWFDKVEGLPHL